MEMIGCFACRFSDTCPDAFADVSQFCDELIRQAQMEYEEALEKAEGISRGLNEIEESDQKQ